MKIVITIESEVMDKAGMACTRRDVAEMLRRMADKVDADASWEFCPHGVFVNGTRVVHMQVAHPVSTTSMEDMDKIENTFMNDDVEFLAYCDEFNSYCIRVIHCTGSAQYYHAYVINGAVRLEHESRERDVLQKMINPQPLPSPVSGEQ